MEDTLEELRRFVMRAGNKWTDIGVPRVAIVRAEACADQVYQPMLHFVLQGSKALSIGDRMADFRAGTYFVVPVDVPATGQIRPCGPGLPYLAISLALDPEVIAGLIPEGDAKDEHPNGVDFSAVSAPPEMIDAWLRMLRLTERPREIPTLAPMIEREILFRALQGPLGPLLREIARPEGRLVQIRRVTHWIRDHYAESFEVEQLAALAGMSVASLYRHFRAVTAMTPIQYQKRLRLLRARWLMLFEPKEVASIAFAVGYEGASQFTREYARMFGLPPVRDAAHFKTPEARDDPVAA